MINKDNYLKMSQLVKLTGESKPTILFYVREGLLPEPYKVNANMHYYNINSVNIILFIKYLQKNFKYSLDEIKKIFQNNSFDFSGDFDSLINSLNSIILFQDAELTEKDLIQITGCSKDIIAEMDIKELLIKNGDKYSKINIELIEIYTYMIKKNIDVSIFDDYVRNSKALAKKEYDTGAAIIEAIKADNVHTFSQNLVYDLFLKIKPMIFNYILKKEHDSRLIQKEKQYENS